MYNKNKQYKYQVYNSQRSFAKFKDINEFQELSLHSMFKRLNDFKKKFNGLETVNPQTDDNEVVKEKLQTVLQIFLMNSITFTRINTMKQKKRWFKCKRQKKSNYKKLRLTGNYKYKSAEEEQQQTSKKEPPKKLDKKTW